MASGAPAMRLKSILHPALGNHEYATSGASGYFDYFGGAGVAVGKRGEGLVQLRCRHLNSSVGRNSVKCARGSPQEVWLRNDLWQERRHLRCQDRAVQRRIHGGATNFQS